MMPKPSGALAVAVALALALAAGCEGPTGAPVAGPDQRVTVEEGTAPVRGPDTARVTIVEFGDFQCPYCGEMEPVVRQLLANNPDDVRLVFKQFPLSYHSHARLAAEAAVTAGAAGKFWEYHDLLYAHQSALARADLEAYAAEVGLDVAAFSAALDAGTAAAAVDADLAQGEALGVPGTPAFYINGRLAFGAMSLGELQAVVDEELSLAAQ
jgi:protein-disulfide isomerase